MAFKRRGPGSACRMNTAGVTVSVCLLLTVLLALWQTAVYSVSAASARVVLKSALEQSLYSLFAGYDRELYSRFGILFPDGGFGKPELSPGAWTAFAEKHASYIIDPGYGKSIPEIIPAGCLLTDYTLCTDGGCEALRSQIRELEKLREQSGDSAAMNQIRREAARMEAFFQNSGSEMIRWDPAEARFLAEQAARTQAASADPDDHAEEPGAADEQSAGADSAKDQHDNTAGTERSIRLLRTGAPELFGDTARRLSRDSASLLSLPSSRILQEGMGVVSLSPPSADENRYFMNYVYDRFPCFTDGTDSRLSLQAEYALEGEENDAGNFIAAAEELLHLRWKLDYYAICTDNELYSMVPEGGGNGRLLLYGWSYSEAVSDVRILLAGGSVPLIKGSGDFLFSPESLPEDPEDFPHPSSGTGSGMDYREHLFLTAVCRDTSPGMLRIADLIEYNMRYEAGRGNFRIDNCLASCGMELSAYAAGSLLCSAQLTYQIHS